VLLYQGDWPAAPWLRGCLARHTPGAMRSCSRADTAGFWACVPEHIHPRAGVRGRSAKTQPGRHVAPHSSFRRVSSLRPMRSARAAKPTYHARMV